jgi:D-alanyl-D-alanine endopeptidase (penicillin-binding protein 7)
MQFRTRRAWSVLLMVAFAAGLAATVEAATPRHSPSRARVHRAVPATRKAAKQTVHRRSRRSRRAPPGGVYARSAIVLDPSTGQVLFEKNAERSVPIASLTKLMTALVFLEQKPDLSRSAEVTRTDIDGGGHTRLRRGEFVALRDLLHMSLMCSDNVATRVLVRESGVPPEDFLARMNKKANELGMPDTRFVEFTGLDVGDVSTAADVARLLRAAADNDLIRGISTTVHYDFRSDAYQHQVVNTNRLLYNRHMEIIGGKTGFINESGYCLATWIRAQGRDLIAVVLGAPTNATRFADVVRLVQRTISGNQPRSQT